MMKIRNYVLKKHLHSDLQWRVTDGNLQNHKISVLVWKVVVQYRIFVQKNYAFKIKLQEPQ